MNPGTPSATAQLVATSIAASSLEPELAPLLAPGMGSTSAALLQAGTRGFRMLATLVRRGWARALASAIETLTLPGIRAHYIVRKRWLEDVARQRIAGGVAQVVVIGAGLDTLALRLHREFPAVRFLELDHPATQAAKRRGLEALGPGTNLELAPCARCACGRRRPAGGLSGTLRTCSGTSGRRGTALPGRATLQAREAPLRAPHACRWTHPAPGPAWPERRCGPRWASH